MCHLGITNNNSYCRRICNYLGRGSSFNQLGQSRHMLGTLWRKFCSQRLTMSVSPFELRGNHNMILRKESHWRTIHFSGTLHPKHTLCSQRRSTRSIRIWWFEDFLLQWQTDRSRFRTQLAELWAAPLNPAGARHRCRGFPSHRTWACRIQWFAGGAVRRSSTGLGSSCGLDFCSRSQSTPSSCRSRTQSQPAVLEMRSISFKQ